MDEPACPCMWTIDLNQRPDDAQIEWIETVWNSWMIRIEHIDSIYRLHMTKKTDETGRLVISTK